MARTQAADYGERRKSIVEKAAELYAERGFLGASLSDLAQVCGVSKSLIYHYYPSKEDILFEVMHSHVATLLTATEAVAALSLPPKDALRAITTEFMKHYVGATARQKVLLNELNHLPKQRRATIIGIQHKLIDFMQDILTKLHPDLGGRPALRRPAVMLYFGMINWTHTWFNPAGKAGADQVADLTVDIMLKGLPGV